MIRANALMSMLIVSVISAACSNSGSKAPANNQVRPGQNQPNTPGVVGNQMIDPTLAKSQAVKGSLSTGDTTIRPQALPDDPAPVVEATTAAGDTTNANSFTYNEAAGTATMKEGVVGETYHVDPHDRLNNDESNNLPANGKNTASDGQSNTSANNGNDQTTSGDATTDASAGDDISSAQTGSAIGDPGQSPVIVNSASAPVLHAEDLAWTPGLPREPADTAIYTKKNRDSDSAAYTDGKTDAIMDVLTGAAIANAELADANKEFAKRIYDVHFAGATAGKITSYTFTVSIQDESVPIVFSGTHDLTKVSDDYQKAKKDKANQTESQKSELMKETGESRTFKLEPTNAKKLKDRYSAEAHCSDASFRTCQNVVLELRRLNLDGPKASAPLAVAYIVHREGPAVLTIDSRDQPQNENHKAFNKLLSEARTSKKGGWHVLLRTWAVAYGASIYEVIFAHPLKKPDPYHANALVLSGDLVVTGKPEKVALHDREGRDKWLNAELMMNDGGGNLNFRVSFKGASNTERFSVSSNLVQTVIKKSQN